MKNRKSIISILSVLAVCITVILMHAAFTFNPLTQSFSTETQTSVPLKILMYHDISSRPPGPYTLPPDDFEKDLQYIQAQGYTTITISDLIAFQTGDTPLPCKPIMLTFDDGDRSNYTVVFPLLQKYQMKAVMSVVGKYIDQNYYADGSYNTDYQSNLTYAQIKEMSESGLVEIQNHGYNMHSLSPRRGMRNMKKENFSDYENALSTDLQKLHALLLEKCAVTCSAVAFPFGSYSSSTIKVIEKNGYKAALTCSEGINHITKTSSLFHLKRYNRPHGKSVEKILG